MCGLTKMHAANKTPTEYAYYVCQYNPNTPSHVAAAPGHPRTVQVREDFIKGHHHRHHPAIVTALLARASDDPATQAAATPATSTDTSPAPLQGSLHIPIH